MFFTKEIVVFPCLFPVKESPWNSTKPPGAKSPSDEVNAPATRGPLELEESNNYSKCLLKKGRLSSTYGPPHLEIRCFLLILGDVDLSFTLSAPGRLGPFGKQSVPDTTRVDEIPMTAAMLPTRKMDPDFPALI